jgi:hypothetical protein
MEGQAPPVFFGALCFSVVAAVSAAKSISMLATCLRQASAWQALLPVEKKAARFAARVDDQSFILVCKNCLPKREVVAHKPFCREVKLRGADSVVQMMQQEWHQKYAPSACELKLNGSNPTS